MGKAFKASFTKQTLKRDKKGQSSSSSDISPHGGHVDIRSSPPWTVVRQNQGPNVDREVHGRPPLQGDIQIASSTQTTQRYTHTSVNNVEVYCMFIHIRVGRLCMHRDGTDTHILAIQLSQPEASKALLIIAC